MAKEPIVEEYDSNGMKDSPSKKINMMRSKTIVDDKFRGKKKSNIKTMLKKNTAANANTSS